MALTVSTTLRMGPRVVVRVSGEIDIGTAASLQDELAAVLGGDVRRLVVDLSGVTFLDSTGLNALVATLHRVRGMEGTMRLVCTGERILKILAVTGVGNVLPVHASVPAALAADASAEHGG